MVDFVVLIPARLASTRLPNKALLDIAGLPMVVRVARQAAKSQAENVYVATDNQLIFNTCRQYDVPCVMTQESHQSGTDRLAEAVTRLDLPDGMMVVNVQGDEPLIDPKLMDDLAAHLAQSGAPMATAAQTIKQLEDFENPNVVKVVLDSRSCALYFSRASIPYPRQANHEGLPQDLAALHHIGIYAYRTDFLKAYHTLGQAKIECTESLEQLRVLWHGYDISVLITERATASGVDTEEDLARVRALFQ